MRRSRSSLALVVAMAIVLLAVPQLALAAGTSAKVATQTAPLAPGPIDAQIWAAQDGQQTAVIIGISVDPKVKLPARVRIPVPKGAVVQWAGEILNGDASADKQRDFTVFDGAGGGTYAEFTLSVSHRGQIDTSGIGMTVKGNIVSTQVEWIQSAPATSTIFTVRLPAGISDVKIEPAPEGNPTTNSGGESLYLLPLQKLATGAKTTVKAEYNVSPTGETAGKATNLTAVYIVLGILLVGALAVVAYLAMKQGAARPARDKADSRARVEREAPVDPTDTWDIAEPEDDPFDIDFDEK